MISSTFQRVNENVAILPERLPELKGEIFDEIYSKGTKAMAQNLSTEYEKMARSISQLSRRNHNVILEVACGDGYFAKKLAVQYPDSRIIAEDIDPNVIDFARRNNSAPNLKYHVGDVYSLSERHNGVNVAIVKDSFHHFNDIGKAMGEIFNSLDNAGTLVGWDVDRRIFYEKECLKKQGAKDCANFLRNLRTDSNGEEAFSLLKQFGVLSQNRDLIVGVMSFMAGYTSEEISGALERSGFNSVTTDIIGSGYLAIGNKG